MSEHLIRHFQQMARNNRWANHRLYKACMALDAAEFTARRVSFFPSLSLTLNHLYAVDLYYLDALEEGGVGRDTYRKYVDIDDAAALADRQAAADRRLITFCDRLTADDLDRRIAMDREEHGVFHEDVPAILAHLFQHQIHHRGQAHAMLAGTSVKPPQLDEYFLDYDRATDIGEALGEARGNDQLSDDLVGRYARTDGS